MTTNDRGQRCAYGYDADDNKCFYFYVIFADAQEEAAFQEDWAAFKRTDPTSPHLRATDPPNEPPPGCGTPWTDPCGDPPDKGNSTTPSPIREHGHGRVAAPGHNR